ncbi:MAG: histidinol-phosphatase [Clostridia bacterium]|nr:histidinol-phosphatase [Clostridia bacterium]
MIANYHTHTFRCHHAHGTEEEYIARAIESGIKILGFSDHAPFAFPDGTQSSYRVFTSDAEDYITTINALKEKYKDKIEIYVGFEMEYFPMFFDGMLEYVKRLGAEYLILGQHFINNGLPKSKYAAHEGLSTDDLKEYVDCVVGAIKSGKFSYIAHPDIFNYDFESEEYYREMKRLCITAREFDVPLEINFLGIKGKRIYPNRNFLKIAAEVGNEVVFGSDAHDPISVYDEATLQVAEKLVSDLGLKKIDTVKLKFL